MRDCSFSVERCRVEVKLKQDVETDCLLDNWDEDQNFMIGSPATVIVDPGYFGELRYDSCNTPPLIPGTANQFPSIASMIYSHGCLPIGDPAEGWAIYRNVGQFIPDDPDGNTGQWAIETTYVREVAFYFGSPGPEWVNIGINTWARVPVLDLDFFTGTTMELPHRFELQYKSIYPPGGFTNGRYLGELIEHLLDESCAGAQFVSNFFAINPDGSEPMNDYYTAAIDYQNMAMFPVHDQAKTDETEASFRIEWSLEDLINDLKNVFNLTWFFDGGKYRLEHISYFAGVAGLDLTTAANQKYISGKWDYTYDKSKLFKEEQWRWVIDSKGVSTERNDFNALPIRYDSKCLDKQSTDKTRALQILIADFTDIADNESFIGTHFFVLAALDSNDRVSIDPGYWTSDLKLNARMGFPELHEKFWKYGRPLPTGKMNLANTIFEGIEKVRKQVPISLPMCCPEFEANFNPNGLIRTQLGDGEIEEATYEEPSERLTLNLKHL